MSCKLKIIFSVIVAALVLPISAIAQNLSGAESKNYAVQSVKKSVEGGAAIATKVMVRVVAHDAKVIGEHVGGVRVTIRDAASKKILTTGVQNGGSGNTDVIMRQPRTRGAKIFDTPDSSGFLATLDLDKPTVVEIAAEGPVNYPGSAQRSSKTMLIIPGQDILGEGVLLELQGLIVALKTPQPILQLSAGHDFDLEASVMMMCGCPIQPGGIWDASKMSITARVFRGNTIVAEFPFTYAGQPSTFTGKLQLKDPGQYELQIVASDPADANFGMMKQKITVGK